MGEEPAKTGAKPTRRKVLSGTALGGVAVAAATPRVTAAATPREPGEGRKFRGLVVRPGNRGRVEEATLLPIRPREVVMRNEAAYCSYTMSRQALGVGPPPAAGGAGPLVLGQGAVGIIEAVGSMVKRVRPGDRVIVAGNPQCGQCYQCLQGRAEWCQLLLQEIHPYATLSDGVAVSPRGGIGGIAEITVTSEEHCVPLWTNLPAHELAVLGNTAGIGLASGMTLVPIEPGSDVVVLGCGPLGLSAVQSARIMGATQIIAVEPIAYRREAAMKLGATMVLDPNVEGNGLIEKIRNLCKGPTDRVFSGGRVWSNDLNIPRGCDFCIEAVGGDVLPPKAGAGPDPTGILPLRQAFEITRAGGHVIYLGAGQQGDVSIPGFALSNRGRTLHSAQMGGMHVMRDLPRYVKLTEAGKFDAKTIADGAFPLDRVLDGFQAVADRTTISACVVFPG
jgi:S-(hydroxymethyl)glutathione dehydrogenase/alcohol dehydrogenase